MSVVFTREEEEALAMDGVNVHLETHWVDRYTGSGERESYLCVSIYSGNTELADFRLGVEQLHAFLRGGGKTIGATDDVLFSIWVSSLQRLADGLTTPPMLAEVTGAGRGYKPTLVINGDGGIREITPPEPKYPPRLVSPDVKALAKASEELTI